MTRSYFWTAGFLALGLCAGFLREILIARLYGVSEVADIFRIAFGLPSILSDGMAVSFVAVLLPLLSQQKCDTRSVISASWIFAALLCAIGWLTMGWQARVFAPGLTPETLPDLVWLGRMCWIMCFVVLLSLPLRADLSRQGITWPAASAPLIRSVGFITALLIAQTMRPAIPALGAACLCAGGLVLIVHLSTDQTRPKMRVPIKEIRPVWIALFSVLILQISLSAGRILDRAYASLLQTGTVASVEYSYALIMAFGVILATSLNIWQAPRLNAAFAQGKAIGKTDLKIAFGVITLAIYAGLMLSFMADNLVSSVYQSGAFDMTATRATADIFRWQALAIGPLVAALWLTQVALIAGARGLVLRLAIVKMLVKWIALVACLQLGGVSAPFGISMVIAECVFALSLAWMLVGVGVLNGVSRQRQAEQKI